MATITIAVEDGPTRRMNIRSGAKLIVGRSPEIDLHIPHPRVSNYHLELINATGGLRARDLSSKNGTTLNGTPMRQSPLVERDVLILGSAVRIEVVSLADPSVGAHVDSVNGVPLGQDPSQTEQELAAYRWAIRRFREAMLLTGPLARLQFLVEQARSELGGSAEALLWRGDLAAKSMRYELVVSDTPSSQVPSRHALPTSIVAEMRKTGGPVWSDNVQNDARFASSDSVQLLSAQIVGCLPLGPHGALFVFPERPSPPPGLLSVQVLADLLGHSLPTWEPEQQLEFEPLPGLVGRSAAMRELTAKVRSFASLPFSILLTGERGCGKSHVARAIHSLSRPSEPFEVGDCASLPPTLAASHLFGHDRGAFTGADRARVGWFEAAGQGTLFLDEVGELPAEIQRQLLVVLEDRVYKPLGSGRSHAVHARIVSATNRSHDELTIPEGLREDLYDRLAQMVIRVPPLRERREDIPDLARHLFATLRAEVPEDARHQLPAALDDEAAFHLAEMTLEGNVRELQNLIRRAVGNAVQKSSDTVRVSHLLMNGGGATAPTTFRDAMATRGRELLRNAYIAEDGVQKRAARRLGMSEQAWYRARRTYGFDPEDLSNS